MWTCPARRPHRVHLLVLPLVILTLGMRTDTAAAQPLPTEVMRVAKPRGTIVGVHGGAWLLTGTERLMRMPRPALARWRKAGWNTINVDYRPGAVALSDVRRAVRQARLMSPRVCIYGESAGGHLALLAAARMHVDCVETMGAPTDLRALPEGDIGRAASIAFAGRLAEFSPALMSSGAAVLLAHAGADPVVPSDQARRLNWPSVERLVLAAGSKFLVHSGVAPGALRSLVRAEHRLRQRVARRS